MRVLSPPLTLKSSMWTVVEVVEVVLTVRGTDSYSGSRRQEMPAPTATVTSAPMDNVLTVTMPQSSAKHQDER